MGFSILLRTYAFVFSWNNFKVLPFSSCFVCRLITAPISGVAPSKFLVVELRWAASVVILPLFFRFWDKELDYASLFPHSLLLGCIIAIPSTIVALLLASYFPIAGRYLGWFSGHSFGRLVNWSVICSVAFLVYQGQKMVGINTYKNIHSNFWIMLMKHSCACQLQTINPKEWLKQTPAMNLDLVRR